MRGMQSPRDELSVNYDREERREEQAGPANDADRRLKPVEPLAVVPNVSHTRQHSKAAGQRVYAGRRRHARFQPDVDRSWQRIVAEPLNGRREIVESLFEA